MALAMTQSLLVKKLADAVGTNGRVPKAFLENYAAISWHWMSGPSATQGSDGSKLCYGGV